MKTIERTTEKKTTTIPTTSTEVFKVGDYVRSYDFETTDDCYIEGVVDRVGGSPFNPNAKNYISFKCHTKVFSGKEIPVFGARYWVAQNGSYKVLESGTTNRVVRLDNKDYTPILKAKGLI